MAVAREEAGVSGICACHGGLADPWSASSLPMVPPIGEPIACAAVAAAADCQSWLLRRLSGVSIPLVVTGVYIGTGSGAACAAVGRFRPELSDGE